MVMTIYQTPYNPETLRPTGHSIESPFKSLGQVMGPPATRGPRWLGYGDVAFSDFVFYVGEREDV